MQRSTAGRSLFAAVAAIGLTMFGGSAFAQDADAGAELWRTSQCQQCHGWAADGIGVNAQMEGPSLRDTFLLPNMVADVIKCGRPGTAMPTFRNNAWTPIIPCYGRTEPMEGNMQPAPGERMYSDRAIDNIVAFLFRDIVGAGPVTNEYCIAFLGAESARCAGYPTEAEIAADAADHGG